MPFVSTTFDLAFVGVIVGMVLLLYGVFLDSGLALNSLMIVGGLIGLVSIFAMTVDSVRAPAADH